MSNIPADLKYTSSHEWIRDNGDGTVTIGITDHAQAALGDIVYVELPELEAFEAQDACTVVESVKAASDVYCPLAGTVVEVNDELEDIPERVNDDAYGEGWMFMLQLDSVDDLAGLLDATAYAEKCHD